MSFIHKCIYTFLARACMYSLRVCKMNRKLYYIILYATILNALLTVGQSNGDRRTRFSWPVLLKEERLLGGREGGREGGRDRLTKGRGETGRQAVREAGRQRGRQRGREASRPPS